MTLLTPKLLLACPKVDQIFKTGKNDCHHQVFHRLIEKKVPVGNFSVLSQYLRVQSLIDPFDANLGAQKRGIS